MTEEDVYKIIEQKDVEIERLNNVYEKRCAHTDELENVLDAKDAEIERLCALVNSSAEAMQSVIDDQRKLIGELSDALFKQRGGVFEDALIQRARKAIK